MFIRLFLFKKFRQIPCIVGVDVMRGSWQVAYTALFICCFFAKWYEVDHRLCILSNCAFIASLRGTSTMLVLKGSLWSDVTSALTLEQRHQFYQDEVYGTL